MGLVLMYHDVYKETPSESGFDNAGANYYKLQEQLFEGHIKKIQDLKKNVVLTFDDGGVSFYNIIVPILDKYGMRGHFFIPSNYIGKNGFLEAEHIRSLKASGHNIGSHSFSHPDNMTSLNLELRRKEWEQSLKQLSDIIGVPVTEVSIPNGYYDKGDIEFLRELGVTRIYTSSPSDNFNVDNVAIIGRYAINHDTSESDLQKIINSRLRQYVIIARCRLLTFVKNVMGDRYLRLKRIIRNSNSNE